MVTLLSDKTMKRPVTSFPFSVRNLKACSLSLPDPREDNQPLKGDT